MKREIQTADEWLEQVNWRVSHLPEDQRIEYKHKLLTQAAGLVMEHVGLKVDKKRRWRNASGEIVIREKKASLPVSVRGSEAYAKEEAPELVLSQEVLSRFEHRGIWPLWLGIVALKGEGEVLHSRIHIDESFVDGSGRRVAQERTTLLSVDEVKRADSLDYFGERLVETAHAAGITIPVFDITRL